MLKYFFCIALAFCISSVQADETADLKQKLQKLLPNIVVDEIQPLANTGLYEAVINGEVVYFSADGKYVFQGDVISLETRESVTENRRISLRKAILDGLNEKDMIVFEPKKTEHTLTVFTDIDCGYCRKLHSQMNEYNDLGIRIRYMAFPRAGIGSKSYKEAVSVWCAEDKNKAMTLAKSGQQIDEKTCDNPVKTDYEIGRKLGVSGTPAMFTESGQILPGYVPPKKLKEILDKGSKS
jgi:thiol:disulfide interchange protein DsbC